MVGKSRNRILGFYAKHPLVGLIGTVASVLSLILWFVQSKRDLCYYVSPARASIVRAGQTSRLSTLFDGKPVETDISAAQIAIWNDGKAAIRPEHVLEPLIIYTKDESPILEARIQKQTREVVKLAIDENECSKGRLKVNWSILEKNDGGIIQIIYTSGTELAIEVKSVLEGQKECKAIRTKGDLKAFIGSVIACFLLLVMLVCEPEIFKKQDTPSRISLSRSAKIFLLSCYSVLIGVTCFLGYVYWANTVPFDV